MLQNYAGIKYHWEQTEKSDFAKMLKDLLAEVRFYLLCIATNIFPRTAVNIYQIFAFRWWKLYVMIERGETMHHLHLEYTLDNP